MKITWPAVALLMLVTALGLSCSLGENETESEQGANSQTSGSGADAADVAAITTPAEPANRGESLYASHCAQCHDQAVYKAPAACSSA
jgi:mono/diheme cytochrome c family protein